MGLKFKPLITLAVKYREATAEVQAKAKRIRSAEKGLATRRENKAKRELSAFEAKQDAYFKAMGYGKKSL